MFGAVAEMQSSLVTVRQLGTMADDALLDRPNGDAESIGYA